MLSIPKFLQLQGKLYPETGRKWTEAQRDPQKASGFLGQEQRCVEDDFPLDDAVCLATSFLQPEAILRQVLGQVRFYPVLERGAKRVHAADVLRALVADCLPEEIFGGVRYMGYGL